MHVFFYNRKTKRQFHYSKLNLRLIFETPLFYATPALWPGAHRNNVTNGRHCHIILGHFICLLSLIFSISRIHSKCKNEIFFKKFI